MKIKKKVALFLAIQIAIGALAFTTADKYHHEGNQYYLADNLGTKTLDPLS